SYSGNGRVNSMVGRLLDMATSQNKLDELTGRVDDTLKKIPAWKAGGALKALIACRSARYDEADRLIRELLEHPGNQQLDAQVFWIIGNELENYATMKDLAVRVYEHSSEGPALDPFTLMNFEYSPMKRLVNIYMRDGRRDDARRVLLGLARHQDFPNYNEEYVSQMRLSGLAAAARQLVEIGFPADAVPLYNEALAAAETIPENR